MKESITQADILRVAVDDVDTTNTPGWTAKYTIIEGNEQHNYKIETDPKTNEGILSVIKVALLLMKSPSLNQPVLFFVFFYTQPVATAVPN